MMAVFSTPLMVAWAEFGGARAAAGAHLPIVADRGSDGVHGRAGIPEAALDGSGIAHLLRLSRQNLDEMCNLKDELENKEQSLRWHSLELQRKNLELQQISFTDPLTGVWNRRYLEEILTAEAGQVLRNYERARGRRHSKSGPSRPGVHHGGHGFLQRSERPFMVIRRAIGCCNWSRSGSREWSASRMCWCVGVEKNF